jgi:uncharacterized membrane protein YjjB (DUF3815 family)
MSNHDLQLACGIIAGMGSALYLTGEWKSRWAVAIIAAACVVGFLAVVCQ